MPLYHALGRYDGYNLKTILLQKGITPRTSVSAPEDGYL
jgi:hypothetical protein